MLTTLRAALFTDPFIILWTAVMATLSFLASFIDRTGFRQHRLAQIWGRVMLRVAGVRVTVEGLDRIDPEGSYVFVANHQSYLDTPLILGNIPVQFRFLAKDPLFRNPLLGAHLRRAGHIPVVRNDPRASLRSMTDAARVIHEKRISVLLFPEGGRTATGELQEFKEGAAYIAIKSGAPAVPLAISGTHDILPPGNALVRPGEVRLRIGEPISMDGLTLKDRGRLNEIFRQRIGDMLEVGESARAGW